MIGQSYYLIAFDSTHDAMAAEAFLKDKKVNMRLIPLPSAISTGCGFSIKVLPNELEVVEGWLRQSAFEWSALYKLVKNGSQTHVEYWQLSF